MKFNFSLKAADQVDFEIQKLATPVEVNSHTYYAVWLGRHETLPKALGWQIDAASLTMGGDINNVFTNPPLPQSIRPPQTRPVSDFINKAQPILMFSFVQNVEQPSGTSPPDGFASRPFLLNEPALAGHNASPGSMAMVRHTTHPPTPVSAVA